MADEHSRDYEDDYSPDSGDGGMESEHNYGAKDGAPDGELSIMVASPGCRLTESMMLTVTLRIIVAG